MQFNEETHKVDIETLTKEEARDFILFLEEEIERHKEEVRLCKEVIDDVRTRGNTSLFFRSAMLRHGEDIHETSKLIRQVMEKFGL